MLEEFKMRNAILAVALIFFSTGCTSIIKGTDQTLTFSSEPSGAEVIIDGNSQGKTPLSVKLKKSKYQSVMVKKAGYNPVVRPLDKSYDGLTLLNIFWDLSITDFITGAAYEYQPSSYHFTLEKSDSDTDDKENSSSGKSKKKE